MLQRPDSLARIKSMFRRYVSHRLCIESLELQTLLSLTPVGPDVIVNDASEGDSTMNAVLLQLAVNLEHDPV